MMDAKQRKEALKRGGPSKPWQTECLLGGYYGEEEVEAAVRAIRGSMDPTVGFGFECEELDQLEQAFATYVGTSHCLAVNGAGTGLDMAMMLLNLEPGDEVIVPAVNFRAAPNAVYGAGGKVVWCEVDPKTLNADPNDVEKQITPRTRAIFPVHNFGLSAPMDELLELGRRYPHQKHGPLKVIGDAARACGGGDLDTKIGKKGWMTVFSFHTQKNMTTLGEGGAITTDDGEIVPRLGGIRQFGWNTIPGDVHLKGIGWGSNYKMTKVQAAVGLVQLGRLDDFIARRRKVAQARKQMLAGCEDLTPPYEPPGYFHTYYLYPIQAARGWAGERMARLRSLLREEYKVECSGGGQPLHKSRFYDTLNPGQELPVSEEVMSRTFCVPIHPYMPEGDNEYIAASVLEAVARVKKL